MAECEFASACVCACVCVHICVFVYVDIDPVNTVGEFKQSRLSSFHDNC